MPIRRDADVVLVGGRIFTATRSHPWARALAIRGDRLVSVGTNAQAERWADRRTRILDLRGRVVVPGFIDAHAHLADAAGEFGSTRLDGTRTLDAAVDRLKRAAGSAPRGAWIVGIDWDESKWRERRYLDRSDLDRASADHPVVAVRIDGHMGALNRRALEEARDLAGVPGFEVDGVGRPTGILKEDAFLALRDRIRPTEAQMTAGLPAMARRGHRLGITSVHDIVGFRGWRAYQRAYRAGRLRLRVYAMLRESLLPSLTNAGLMTGLGDPWLRLGCIKVFADGSLGAYTAALSEPYMGRPGERGMLLHSRQALRSVLEAAHRAGFQTATHAIGDRAIDITLDVLEAIREEDPRKDSRHRIEHFELPSEDALRRMRSGGFIASCQPNFVGQWSGPGDLYEDRLGVERSAGNNPYRRIRSLGIPLCFGSDGMPYGPLYGLHWAVNGYHGGQRLRVEDALRAYTAGGAYASFEEGAKGTLEPGCLADFVVLRGDPFRAPEALEGARVESTWIGGRRVFGRGPKA